MIIPRAFVGRERGAISRVDGDLNGLCCRETCSRVLPHVAARLSHLSSDDMVTMTKVSKKEGILWSLRTGFEPARPKASDNWNRCVFKSDSLTTPTPLLIN